MDGVRRKWARVGVMVRPWGDLHISGTLKVWGEPHGEDYFTVDSNDVGVVVGSVRWCGTQYYQVLWGCGVGWVHGGMLEVVSESSQFLNCDVKDI
jgi:hypothetical protein